MNKKRILIISIIILLILLILGGFFIFKIMNKKKTTSKNNKYKVVLVNDDKKEEKEVKENETLKLEKKEKEGYVFKGWEDEDKKLYTYEVKVSKNLKLKAVFEKKEDQTTQPQTSEEENKPETSDNNQNNNTSKKYYCDKGYTLRGTNCIKTEKVNATSSARCPAGFTEEAGKCIHIMNAGPNCAGLEPRGEYKLQGDGICHHPTLTPQEPNYEICPAGYEKVPDPHRTKCKKTVNKVVSYHCPAGYSLSGTSCFKTITIKAKLK